jgi:hypothetical protein
LVDADHVHDDKDHEHGKQAAREDEQVLRFKPLKLDAFPNALIYIVFHNRCSIWDYRKKERRIVAATIRKIQAPNQEAAVLDVSGSPALNLPIE